jgi:hypothetical protein
MTISAVFVEFIAVASSRGKRWALPGGGRVPVTACGALHRERLAQVGVLRLGRNFERIVVDGLRRPNPSRQGTTQ